MYYIIIGMKKIKGGIINLILLSIFFILVMYVLWCKVFSKISKSTIETFDSGSPITISNVNVGELLDDGVTRKITMTVD